MVKISDFANVKYCSYALFRAESARFLKKWLLVIKIFCNSRSINDLHVALINFFVDFL